MSTSTFIKKIAPCAKKTQREYQIFACVTIAQAILESAWGRSKLTKKSNNLFGMKAGTLWNGATYRISTREERRDGSSYYVVAAFRKYPSWEASVLDHGKFLSTDRYKKVRNAKTWEEACVMLYKCGYATDHNYPNLLKTIIKQYNLHKYDVDLSESSTEYPGYVLQYAPHKEDKHVKKLKKKLKALGYKGFDKSGKFGQGTLKAVKLFQKNHGLAVDGIVGPATWKKLFN